MPGIDYFVMKEGKEDSISGHREVDDLWMLQMLAIFLNELE